MRWPPMFAVVFCLLLLSGCGDGGSSNGHQTAFSNAEGIVELLPASGETINVAVVDESGQGVSGVRIDYAVDGAIITGVVFDPEWRYLPNILELDGWETARQPLTTSGAGLETTYVALDPFTIALTIKLISVGVTAGSVAYHAMKSAGHFTIVEFSLDEVTVCADEQGATEFAKMFYAGLGGAMGGYVSTTTGELLSFGVEEVADLSTGAMVDFVVGKLFEGYDPKQAYTITRARVESDESDSLIAWRNTGKKCTPLGGEEEPPQDKGPGFCSEMCKHLVEDCPEIDVGTMSDCVGPCTESAFYDLLAASDRKCILSTCNWDDCLQSCDFECECGKLSLNVGTEAGCSTVDAGEVCQDKCDCISQHGVCEDEFTDAYLDCPGSFGSQCHCDRCKDYIECICDHGCDEFCENVGWSLDWCVENSYCS